MPAPSSLAIATGSLKRYVKEEASYHRELEQQKARIAKLEGNNSNEDDENAEYVLKQERKALSETEAVFPLLRRNIAESRAKLEAELAKTTGESGGDETGEVQNAKDAIAAAQAIETRAS